MRLVRAVLILAVVAAAALGALYYVHQAVFYPEPPSASYPKPKDVAESQRQDIDYARHVFELDRSWTPETLARAKGRMAALEERAGTMSPLQFSFALAEIVALADNGHTNVQAGVRSQISNRAPFRLFPFANGLLVTRAAGAQTDLLGAQVIAVEDKPVSEIVARTRDFFGGLPRSRELGAAAILESPEQLHALGFTAKPETARYRFRLADGSEIDREVAGEPPGPTRVRAYIDRWLSPDPIKDEPSDWRAWIPSDRTPLAFQEPDIPFRVKPLPDMNAVFVQFRENQDVDAFTIADFIAKSKAEIAAAKPHNIILDMRVNNGGDYTLTVDFMRELPSLIPRSGRVYVLTSTLTFSAGISSVAFLKDAGGERVVIAGEPVGDRLIAYGEGGRMILPNSQTSIRFATGLHDYKNGCKWFGPCYWVNYVYSVSVPTLDPELPAPLDGRALAEGRDPAFEAIAAHLSQGL